MYTMGFQSGILLLIMGIEIGASNLELPDIDKSLVPHPPKFVRFSNLGENEHVFANLGRDGSEPALRITKARWSEQCVDEFYGFKAFDGVDILPVLQNAGYKFCAVPKSSFDTALYDIEPTLHCDLPGDWNRLDCKFTSRDNRRNPFFASRLGRKKSKKNFWRRSSDLFRNRVSCSTGGKSLSAQTTECQGLLNSWVNIETQFFNVRAAKESQAAKILAASAPMSALAPEQSTDASAEQGEDSAQDEGPTQTTSQPQTGMGMGTLVGIVTGGCVGVVVIGLMVYKLVHEGSKKGKKSDRKKRVKSSPKSEEAY